MPKLSELIRNKKLNIFPSPVMISASSSFYGTGRSAFIEVLKTIFQFGSSETFTQTTQTLSTVYYFGSMKQALAVKYVSLFQLTQHSHTFPIKSSYNNRPVKSLYLFGSSATTTC